MSHEIFITGIDTGVGKTICSAILTEALQADYWKPIQAGDLENSDTLVVKRLVQNPNTVFFPEAYRLTQALSPDAAAKRDKIQIELDKIIRPKTKNHLIIEGAGGLLVPLNSKKVIADLIQPNDKVVLIIKHYLGSINHSLLAINYLLDRKFEIGLIFVGTPNNESEKSILTLTSVALIGSIPFIQPINKDTIASTAKKIAPDIKRFLNLK